MNHDLDKMREEFEQSVNQLIVSFNEWYINLDTAKAPPLLIFLKKSVS